MNKKAAVLDYTKKHHYFTLLQIIRDTNLAKKIVKDYLYELKQGKAVFDAGYGFYSSVPEVFTLPKVSRVKEITQFIKKKFPYTDFVIWDTKALQSFYHHTQTHHITFVEVEKEAMASVYESLYEKHQNVIKEKQSNAFYKDFDVKRNPIVVRGLLTRSPKDEHTPALEKILVDMFVDMDKYNYISLSDYLDIWKDLVQTYRINIGFLHSYSKRRLCWNALFSQLIEIKDSYSIDFYQILRELGRSL